MPLASFKILSIEDTDPHLCYLAGNDIGMFLMDQIDIYSVIFDPLSPRALA